MPNRLTRLFALTLTSALAGPALAAEPTDVQSVGRVAGPCFARLDVNVLSQEPHRYRAAFRREFNGQKSTATRGDRIEAVTAVALSSGGEHVGPIAAGLVPMGIEGGVEPGRDCFLIGVETKRKQRPRQRLAIGIADLSRQRAGRPRLWGGGLRAGRRRAQGVSPIGPASGPQRRSDISPAYALLSASSTNPRPQRGRGPTTHKFPLQLYR